MNEPEAAHLRLTLRRVFEFNSAAVLVRKQHHQRFQAWHGTLDDKHYLLRLVNKGLYQLEALHKRKPYPGKLRVIVN